jgi:hypothetical protein
VGAGVRAEGCLRFLRSIPPGLATVAALAKRLQFDADNVPARVAFDVIDLVRWVAAVRTEREALQLRTPDRLPLLSPVWQIASRVASAILFPYAGIRQRTRWPVLR